MAIAPNPEDLEPLRPSEVAVGAEDPDAVYWRQGRMVLCRGIPVHFADPGSFVYFLSGFAKDARHCYCNGRRLAGADAIRFTALNFTFATDGQRVWCVGGEVKGARASHFTVLDDGRYVLERRTVVPHSYARDDERVYFYNYDGKANEVRGADLGSFVSLGDGVFGTDAHHVFVDGKVQKRIDRRGWGKLGGLYSTDGKRVYYGEFVVESADLASFRAVESRSDIGHWAVDSRRRYRHGRPLGEDAPSQEFWLLDAIP